MTRAVSSGGRVSGAPALRLEPCQISLGRRAHQCEHELASEPATSCRGSMSSSSTFSRVTTQPLYTPIAPSPGEGGRFDDRASAHRSGVGASSVYRATVHKGDPHEPVTSQAIPREPHPARALAGAFALPAVADAKPNT